LTFDKLRPKMRWIFSADGPITANVIRAAIIAAFGRVKIAIHSRLETTDSLPSLKIYIIITTTFMRIYVLLYTLQSVPMYVDTKKMGRGGLTDIVAIIPTMPVSSLP
jgi:hypothetical protein